MNALLFLLIPALLDSIVARWHAAPGEADTLMLFVEEKEGGIPALKHQGLQLWKGWNLVSFNIVPQHSTPPGYTVMPDIFNSLNYPPVGWFDQNEDQVFSYEYIDQYYPQSGTESWAWEMTHAYMINLHAQHLLELADDDWCAENEVSFIPSIAWNDSLNYTTEGDMYWFFLAFPKSYQIQVRPRVEGEGPFWDMYGDPSSVYTDNVLKVVKADDGRIFLPNYDPQGHDYDEIHFLEPGRGYALGFLTADPIGMSPYIPWPFCDEYPNEESIGSEGTTKEESAWNISSWDSLGHVTPVPAVHFQFNPRTQWWYPILVDTIALEGITLESGDEVAIFDNGLCVGAVAYQGYYPLHLPAWKDDMATSDTVDGYAPEHEMTFKFFDQSANTEITFQPPPGSLGLEEENPLTPRHSGFGAGAFALRSLVEGVAEVNQLPQEYKLGQNYPNPFNAETIIPLQLPERSQIKVELFNLQGQNLGIIFDGVEDAGQARVHLRAASWASGIYFYRVEAKGLERGGRFSKAGKMLLLK